MNPELLRNVTPTDPQFALKVPQGSAQKFEQNIQQVPEDKWTSWRLHQVAAGETLRDIARSYHVTLAALENANHLDSGAAVPDGFWLNVPMAPPRARLVHYRVHRGETLDAIASRFDVTVSELKRWNHIRGNQVRHGARLRIYAGGETMTGSRSAENRPTRVREVSATSRGASADPVHHKVRRGETLYSIAHQYGTTVSALRESNPFLTDRELKAGDVLSVQR